MKRETIFIGFFCLLLALGMDALTDSRTWVTLWIAGVALWGVCSALTLSERLEDEMRYNRRRLDELNQGEAEKTEE